MSSNLPIMFKLDWVNFISLESIWNISGAEILMCVHVSRRCDLAYRNCSLAPSSRHCSPALLPNSCELCTFAIAQPFHHDVYALQADGDELNVLKPWANIIFLPLYCEFHSCVSEKHKFTNTTPGIVSFSDLQLPRTKALYKHISVFFMTMILISLVNCLLICCFRAQIPA